MNGVSYENRRRQNDIPQFSTERAEQENESINPYMEDTDFNEKAFGELVVGGKEGLQPVEKTVIDRCVHVVYRKYFENPTPENSHGIY